MRGALATIRERDIVAGILAVAIVFRALAAMLLPNQSGLLLDATEYRLSASELAVGWQIQTPYQMPLYPLLVLVAGQWQMAADIALSVVTVWLVYALARELFAERWTAALAGLAAACYPPLIFFSVVGLSDTLFIALMLAAFLLWYRGQFTVAAIFAVLAILTRPVLDLFAPLLVLFFALVIHRLPQAQVLRHVAVYALIYGGLMAPWWLHNHAKYGRFVHLTAGFGTQLYAGNNPLNRSGGGNRGVDFDMTRFARIADAVERDHNMRDAAIDYILAHPQRFFELAGLKFIRMWRIWPVNEGYSNPLTITVSIAAFVPVLALSGMGLYFARHELRLLSPILLFGVGYTAVQMVLVGTIRYRLPLEPFLLIFAGAAVSRLLGNRVSVRSAAGSPVVFAS